MKDYVKEAIEAYGEPINSTAKTPATRNLHEVNDTSEPLNEEMSDGFHHIVAKLLHVAKRAQLDIQPTVVFLCRRVRAPTQQDRNKLKRLLQYLNGTIDMVRRFSIRSLTEMAVYVDALHASHEDMRGHTGGCIVMGEGVLHNLSTKQSINTKSSTETEIVGVSDYLPYTIWLLYFMNEQGYKVQKKVLHQDNQSTIKLLKNGKQSAKKQSCHLNICYFWIADRLSDSHMDCSVEFCPTGLMLGDFFTKPLQGSLFQKMRDVVQGLLTIDHLRPEPKT